MRVLHVGKFYAPFHGGIETFMGDLLPALTRLGVANCALVHAHDGNAPWPRLEASDWAAETGPLILRAPCYGRFVYAPVSPAFPLWLKRAAAGFRPDLIYMHVPNTSAFWALGLGSLRAVPWAVHWHADVVSSAHERKLALAYPFYRPFEQALLKRSRGVIATSPPYVESSAALAPWRERCRVVPLGLDDKRISPPSEADLAQARAAWGGEGGLKALAVGRLTYYKGHEVLIRAAARTPGVRVNIVGRGEGRAGLEALITELGVGDRVRLLGSLDDRELNAMMAACDVFCLPSIERTEAFGVVLMEAMRYGRPLVASRIPGSGVGWVVEEGETGLLTPPGDAAALAAALERLAIDPDLRRRLGARAAQRFPERFGIDRIAQQCLDHFREWTSLPG